jgi:Mg2+ and Co2+ transporter CorA
LRLSTSQNKLLYADSIILLVTAFVALGSTVGGIFGMNVMNSLENDVHAFKIVVGTTVACIAVGVASTYAYFRLTGTFPKIFDREYLLND